MTGQASEALVSARRRAALRRCERVLCLSRLESLAERLARLQDEAAIYDLGSPLDVYGDGPVQVLEQRVAELLGAPAAAFFPSGVMAQQAALRVWAERAGRGVVALHPLSHPQVREMDALTALAGLRTIHLGEPGRCLGAADVLEAREPFDILMLELPLRDAGFILPSWEELCATVAAAKARGAVVHIDGARLWECPGHLGRSLTEIAGLADSTYVSFYKSLGGLSGAALTGDRKFIETAGIWRHRYGGVIFQQFPAALAGLAGLDRELPRLPSYVAKAARVAEVMGRTLATTPGARVYPQPPHTQQFQVWLPHPPEALEEVALRQAEATGEALFGRWRDGGREGAMTEMTIGASALEWSDEDVERVLSDFLRRLQD